MGRVLFVKPCAFVAITVATIIGTTSIQSAKSITEQRMMGSELPSKIKEIKNYLSKEINILLMASKQLSGNKFIEQWAKNNSNNDELLLKELNRLVKQYDLATASWANKQSNNYWNQEGFLRTLNHTQDSWFYDFKNSNQAFSISIFQESVGDVKMFINYQELNGMGLAGLAKSIDEITSSFTAFALAPGVLNTTTPLSLIFSSGILLTPAPALPTAFKLSPISISCIFALLTKIASGFSSLEETS
mgnify:CR=1 FL=1